VARLTANPALHLFVRTLTDLTRWQHPVLDRNRLSPDDIHAAHAKIAEAIIARDGALARHRMMTHLEEVSATGPRHPPARPSRGEARRAAGGEALREEPAESVLS
jgi:DNA-binding FadR family transcriptional regulator